MRLKRDVRSAIGGVVGLSARLLKSLPPLRAAAPILDQCVRRARQEVSVRRARRRLDRAVVRQFQERTRSYRVDGGNGPGEGTTGAFGCD